MATRQARDKFPLWLHPSGQWAMKYRGQFHCFGTDRDAALKRFAAEWDDIKAGRKHRPKGEEITQIVNDYGHPRVESILRSLFRDAIQRLFTAQE